MELSRRRVLSLLGSVTTGTLAGCQAPSDVGSDAAEPPTFAGDSFGPYQVPTAVRQASDKTTSAVDPVVAATEEAVLLAARGYYPQDFDREQGTGYRPGFAEVMERDGEGQAARQTLSRPEGQTNFGTDAAMTDATAMVAARGDDATGQTVGAVLVYERTGEGTWERTNTLTGPVGPTAGTLGWRISMSGDTALVSGGPLQDGPGWVSVYERGEGDWAETATLRRTDSAADSFGFEVAVDGDVAVVGDPGTTVHGRKSAGAAHVYERRGEGWSHETRLVAPHPVSAAFVGAAVAVDGDRILVGGTATTENERGSDGSRYRGQQFVFERAGPGQWAHAGTLYPPPSTAGWPPSLALYGDRALVGDELATVAGLGRTGAVYRFERREAFWERTGVLVPTTAETIRLGASVAQAPGVTVASGVVSAEPSDDDRAGAYIYEDAVPTDDAA